MNLLKIGYRFGALSAAFTSTNKILPIICIYIYRYNVVAFHVYWIGYLCGKCCLGNVAHTYIYTQFDPYKHHTWYVMHYTYLKVYLYIYAHVCVYVASYVLYTHKCGCMYVYMFEYMYVYMSVCMFVRTYVRMYVGTYVRTYVCM